MIKQNNLLLLPLILLKNGKTNFMRIIFLSAILSLLSLSIPGQNPKQFTISGYAV